MSGHLKTAWEWRWLIARELISLVALVWAIIRFSAGDWISGAFLLIVPVAEAAKWSFFGVLWQRERRGRLSDKLP
jgi:hypothetical protein